jgi:chemotaxis response regulator CheB
MKPEQPTKILIIDSDESAFEMSVCVAQTLAKLQQVELYHAKDATEALAIMEKMAPDAIVIDDNEPEECELFIENLTSSHPPIVFCTEIKKETKSKESKKPTEATQITYLQRNESLDGLQERLVLAASLGAQSQVATVKANRCLH